MMIHFVFAAGLWLRVGDLWGYRPTPVDQLTRKGKIAWDKETVFLREVFFFKFKNKLNQILKKPKRRNT